MEAQDHGGCYNFQRPTLANIDDQMRATGMSLGEVLDTRPAWDRMRTDPTDIADITGATYTYLMNGRAAHEKPTFVAAPGQRVRLRIANASTMTFYEVRIPGLPMTVVQADGQNLSPVETDELRIAVAGTYDVVVEMPDNGAYTLFAETMDRSGFARGTLAPRAGMSAEVPARRRRPMLTMADMGMMHAGMDDMDGDATSIRHPPTRQFDLRRTTLEPSGPADDRGTLRMLVGERRHRWGPARTAGSSLGW